VPFINWSLLAAVIALVVGFGNSDNLAGAYGIAVTLAMLIDSILIFVVMRRLWNWPMWAAIGIAVTLQMLIDSILIFFVMRMLWRWPVWAALGIAVPLALIDLA
jgi:KUP system potassium uptake protein